MSAGQPKQPVNRKLAYLALVGVGVLGLFAIIAVTLNNPQVEAETKAAEGKAKEVEALPTGDEVAARRQLDTAAQEAERRAGAATAAAGETPPADLPTDGFDADLLGQLDQAEREVSARQPSLAGNGDLPTAPAVFGDATGLGPQLPTQGEKGIGYVHEAYSDKPAAAGDGGGGLFGGDEAEGGDNAPGVYETIKPQQSPSARVITQGALIPVVLTTRIDTRNPGPMVGVVTRTVYDSRTQRIPLIPQGSRLVGVYETAVSPGVDRLPGQFNRLIFPNGSVIELPGIPSAGLDGTIGIKGRYHSNFARAVGPSFVVSVLGQVIDRELPAPPSNTNAGGVTMESPSVAQQVMPKVNEAVMQRYQAAKPYFTAQPGQEIKLILTADLEIPGGRG